MAVQYVGMHRLEDLSNFMCRHENTIRAQRRGVYEVSSVREVLRAHIDVRLVRFRTPIIQSDPAVSVAAMLAKRCTILW